MQKISSTLISIAMIFLLAVSGLADVTIKQRMSMGGQSFESTRQIKGSRERTEQKIQMADPQAAAFMPQIVTITQCDLKRTLKLNDRKQLYLIEPFQTGTTIAPAAALAPSSRPSANPRQGGTVTISYSQRDTGERKTMFGMQARRLVITQEMESSADSCSGPSRTKMEFDGWYVDFSADFNCPSDRPAVDVPRDPRKPDCLDRVVMKGGGGAVKMGFLLEGTMKMFGPDGAVQMTQTTETLELSRATLDAGLFEVPASYKLADSMQELYAVSFDDIGNMGGSRSGRPSSTPVGTPAARSVGLNINFGSNTSVDRGAIESHVRETLAGRGLNVVAGTGTYTLNFDFKQIKESAAGKIGGLFGKVTGVEAKVGKVEVDMTARLSGAATGDVKVRSKFDGPLDDGVRSAVDEALSQLLGRIK